MVDRIDDRGTTMKLRSRLTGTVLVLTLSTFGLAACGSDGGSDDSAKDTTSQTDGSAKDSTDSADDSGKDGKPSKQDVVDGYTDLVGDLLGDTEMPGDILNKVVTCFVDEVYDDASAQTLKAIADGNQAGINPADATLFTDASTTCQKSALG